MKSQTRLSDFTFTFHFHALEKEMATHSNILTWRIPGTEEYGGLLSMGSHRVGHDWSDLAAAAASIDNKNNCGRWCFFLERFLPWEIGKLWGGKNQVAIAFITPMFKWIVPCLNSMILSAYFEWYIWMDQKIETKRWWCWERLRPKTEESGRGWDG